MSMGHKIKRQLLGKTKRKSFTKDDFLGTGSTLLNLACSGFATGGFPKGVFTFIVGDSDSGKTFISMTCLAEAVKNPSFADYRFIHDNPEGGALMNISKFFGEEVEERLEEPPRGTSEYVEDFYRNLDECYQKGEPFIYILDSMDVLNSLADVKQEQKAKRAVDAGKEAGGSYALAKPKLNSAGLRKARAYLKKTGSILIIIAQTRDNIGFGSQFNPKTRSGGHALRFYNRLELWTSPLKELTKDRSVGTKKKKIQQGVLVRVKIKKNHVTGERHSVEVPIYHSYGIDDIGACVDYLVEEGVWKKKGGSINAHHFDLNARRASIIRHVEEESLESKLRKIVRSTWKEVNEQGKLDRKPRYS